MTEVPLSSAARELDRARQLLTAAKLLLDHGFFEDSVSRSYFATFHAACALLATIGRTVRTHEGLSAVIGEHFVRPGTLDPKFARFLTRIAADRNDADYSAVPAFGRDDAATTLEEARAFVGAAVALVDPAT